MPLRRSPKPVTRNTHAVVPEDFLPFDTPPTDEVLQAEYPEPEIKAVDVRLVEAAQVDPRPTELGILRSIDVDSTEPEQILPENPRRAAVTFWIGAGETVRVARTAQEAQRDDSSIIIPAVGGPYRFGWVDACFAMKRASGASTDRFCFATEDWAR